MGDPTSRVRVVLPTEMLVQHFPAGIRLDRSLDLVLVRLHAWAVLVLDKGIKHALGQLPGIETYDLSIELVSAIAEEIASITASNQQNLLHKSIEETLFYIVRPDPELSRSQFEIRFTRFLEQRGAPSLLRMFLSLHLFNLVWFQTAQSFRKLAGTDELFLRYARDVERTCRRIVQGCWKSHEMVIPFVDPFPEKLLKSIEERFQKADSSL